MACFRVPEVEESRLRQELLDVREALDELNAAQAPTLAQRVKDTIEHQKLVSDALVHDTEKLEYSLRAQIRYWMELAILAASER